MSVEHDIIRQFFNWPVSDSAVKISVGDDAAVVDVSQPLAVCADTLVSGTHFSEDMPADVIGWKALAVNLSDLAAMGALPRWMTLCLTIPQVDYVWLERFSAGLKACADEYGVALIGGDTTRGPITTISIQLLGGFNHQSPPLEWSAHHNHPHNQHCLQRSGARPGDMIVVTGALGRAAYCLEVWRNTGVHVEHANRLWRPEPRVAEGYYLRHLASSAIDVSDGLLNDLELIMRASRCKAIVDLEAIPIDEDASLAQALAGGDDYELIATLSPQAYEYVQSSWPHHFAPLTKMGVVSEGDPVQTDSSAVITLMRTGRQLSPDEWPIQSKGFVHFP